MSKIINIGSIALFILLLACINFVNLSTARSSERAKEIGMRKVVGAARFQLVQQFLGESVLISIASLLISIISVKLIMPFFSSLVGTEIGIGYNSDWATMLLILGGALVVGILAGLYPALVISSYQPVEAIKGTNSATRGRNKSFISQEGFSHFQFSISIILIIGTILSIFNSTIVRSYNMGFNKENRWFFRLMKKLGKILPQ